MSDERNEDHRAENGSGNDAKSGDPDGMNQGDAEGKPTGKAASTTEQAPSPTLLEWSVRIVSLLIIVALTGYIVWTAFQPEVAPHFDYRADLDRIELREGSWVVPVKITNLGSGSLEGVTIALQLLAGGEVVEEEPVTLMLIGSEEAKDVEFWFDRDPTDYELRFDVASYRIP